MAHNALGPNPLFFYGGQGGVSTPYGVMLPPGSKVAAYVRSTGVQGDEQDPPAIQNRLVTTLAKGVEYARTGKGDVVVVLPGHVETVSAADHLANLRTTTKIIGVGVGAARPTFNFTAVAAQWLISKAGCSFSNLLFNFGGGAAVAIGVDVTAADVTFAGCEFITAASSTSRADKVMRLSAGADRFQFIDNFMRGTNGANGVVDGILVNAAVAHMQIHRNVMEFGTTVVTVGNIRFATAAATELCGTFNHIWNTTAASTACVDYDVTVTGLWAYNNLATNDGATAPAVSGFLGTLTGSRFFQNFCSTAGASGLLCPAADA